jgi:hypothetical protein
MQFSTPVQLTDLIADNPLYNPTWYTSISGGEMYLTYKQTLYFFFPSTQLYALAHVAKLGLSNDSRVGKLT